MDLQFEYNGLIGERFSVLHVDYETLSHVAAGNGWTCEMIRRVGGHYLARLRPD